MTNTYLLLLYYDQYLFVAIVLLMTNTYLLLLYYEYLYMCYCITNTYMCYVMNKYTEMYMERVLWNVYGTRTLKCIWNQYSEMYMDTLKHKYTEMYDKYMYVYVQHKV